MMYRIYYFYYVFEHYGRRLVNDWRKLIISTKDDGARLPISQTLVRQYLIPYVIGFYRVYIYRIKVNFSLKFIGTAQNSYDAIYLSNHSKMCHIGYVAL